MNDIISFLEDKKFKLNKSESSENIKWYSKAGMTVIVCESLTEEQRNLILNRLRELGYYE